MKQLLPQQCPVVLLYLTWGMYLAGLFYFLLDGEWAAAGEWLVALPLCLWAYVRTFPRISRHLGYGRVDDVLARSPGHSDVRVTLYSSLGCPFCPIVERRLQELQMEMGFDLQRIDVTVRPDVAKARRIRSVPVVEAAGKRLIGHATTRELAELVSGAVSKPAAG